jgi:hypothetical protein
LTSPTQRTLARLRALGYTAAVVERWNPHARVRQDFLGFADVLAVRPGELGVLAVQATTRRNQAARLAKVLTVPALEAWLACGNRCEVWGWAKVGARGRRKLWDVTRQALSVRAMSCAHGGL